MAKLHLAEIFETWGTDVHLHDIYLVVQEWKTGDRQTFIKDMVDTYVEQLNFEMFLNLYNYLQLATEAKHIIGQ